uniref:OB domain-containing protein n=1 Tax=Glossina pallidipes TaxID=7398 RepID=A0A1A9ZNM1_GLOPL
MIGKLKFIRDVSHFGQKKKNFFLSNERYDDDDKVMTRDQSILNSMQLRRLAARQPRKSRMVPVLIKQLLISAEGNFQMFGITFSMVRDRAIVRNIETSSTKITYLLEDNTGQITVHYWLKEDDTLKPPT